MVGFDVSDLQVLFYIGLFIAGLTSSLGVLTGAPRVMQGIGEDVKVFGIEQFAVTFGRSEEPMRALFASAIISACMSLFIVYVYSCTRVNDALFRSNELILCALSPF